MSATTYKPIATMITCREDDEDAMVMLSEYRQLERENAALRASHGEIYAALGTSESDHTKWPQQIAALRKQVAAQGLSLACLADGILGEDAADRSDQTLVRTGCRLAGEVAALRAALNWIVKHGWNPEGTTSENANLAYESYCEARAALRKKAKP